MVDLTPIRVAALTSGRNVPSARFRVRQHISLLRELGVTVEEYCPLIDKYVTLMADHALVPGPVRPALSRMLRKVSLVTRGPGIRASRRADLTWLERELIPGRFSLEDRLGKPLVFDVDDAIWAHRHAHAGELRRLAGESSCVIAGNDYIAEWFRPHAGRVEVIPTAVDTRRFRPVERRQPEGPIRIGWTGTSSNFDYLRSIESELGRFLKAHDATLVVVADRPPRLESVPADRMSFERWTAESEAEAVRRFDVGLMPLSDDEWGRGKCGYKALQYMACGVPAIVSPVGFNRTLVESGGALAADDGGGWLAALEGLAGDSERRVEIGRVGRAVVEREYSCDVISRRLADLLRSVAVRGDTGQGAG